jgi:hypothetical protein
MGEKEASNLKGQDKFPILSMDLGDVSRPRLQPCSAKSEISIGSQQPVLRVSVHLSITQMANWIPRTCPALEIGAYDLI